MPLAICLAIRRAQGRSRCRLEFQTNGHVGLAFSQSGLRANYAGARFCGKLGFEFEQPRNRGRRIQLVG